MQQRRAVISRSYLNICRHLPPRGAMEPRRITAFLVQAPVPQWLTVASMCRTETKHIIHATMRELPTDETRCTFSTYATSSASGNPANEILRIDVLKMKMIQTCKCKHTACAFTGTRPRAEGLLFSRHVYVFSQSPSLALASHSLQKTRARIQARSWEYD